MKKTTIYDISVSCGVSPRTVTRAFQEDSRINDETRRLILDTANKYNYKPNRAAIRLAKPAVKITAAIINTLPLFSDSITKGFLRAQSELSDYKAELDVITAYTDSEIADCCTTLEEKLSGNVCDGLIVMCIDAPSNFLSTLAKYTDSGIPVVKILNDFEGVQSIFNVKNDYKMSGCMACELLSAYTGGESAVLFTGSLKTAIHKEILKGFVSEANIRGITVSEVFDMNDNPELARAGAKFVLNKHPEVKGIYITSANSKEIIDSIAELGKYKIIASDIFPELIQYIENGVVAASIYQNETYQAKTAYKNLYEYIAYGRIPKSEILTYPQIILKSNLLAYI